MVSRSTAIWLLAWIALALGSPAAWGQVPADSNLDYPTPVPSGEYGSAPYAAGDKSVLNGLWPFSPGHVGSYAQPFSPPRTSTYGNGPHPNVGYFFSYERLVWSLSAPDRSSIGAAPLNTPDSGFPTPAFGGNLNGAIDTSFIKAVVAWGNRWEIGYMDDTNYGWMVSILDHVRQGQYQSVDDPLITFGDPLLLLEGFSTVPVPDTDPQVFLTFDIGQLPGAFSELQMQNQTTLNGVALTRMYRAPRLHKGGFFEILYGARWFQIDDAFTVTAFGKGAGAFAITILGTTNTFPFNILDESQWTTRSTNNLVGAEIGLRWFRQRGRWITSAEGRFIAAANFQNTQQVTQLGTDTLQNRAAVESADADVDFIGLGTTTHQYNTVFSPMGEVRVNSSYTVTSKVSVKVGYTGIVVGGVSRAVNRVDYNSPNLVGITPANNREIFFVNGLNFGVEINR